MRCAVANAPPIRRYISDLGEFIFKPTNARLVGASIRTLEFAMLFDTRKMGELLSNISGTGPFVGPPELNRFLSG